MVGVAFVACARRDNACTMLSTSDWDGVMFDIEDLSGSSSELTEAFANAFAAVQSCGLSVSITTSHNAPFATDDPQTAVDLVTQWLTDPNVDMISPQMYTSGNEDSPVLATTSTCHSANPPCDWSAYQGTSKKIVPSIVDSTHLAAVTQFFSDKGIDTQNSFVQWAQEQMQKKKTRQHKETKARHAKKHA